MSQGFGFEAERNHELYVFTDHPEICPDCGGEAAIPTKWEEITKGFWQVDRKCMSCDKPVNTTFLNEREVVAYDDKLSEMDIKTMLATSSKFETQRVPGIEVSPDALEETA